MLAHAFSHDSAAYQVSFTRMDGQWFATISRSDRALSRPLPAFVDEGLGPFSDGATRAGYIALAEWLVKNADWPDADDAGAPPQAMVPAPIDREKAAPCIERPTQERIGRELQALYADLLDEPVPDTLLALLGTGTPPAAAQLSV
jgi:hypothetical protein